MFSPENLQACRLILQLVFLCLLMAFPNLLQILPKTSPSLKFVAKKTPSTLEVLRAFVYRYRR